MENQNISSKCKNNYTESSYQTNFFEKEEDIKNCNKCEHFEYEDGVGHCALYDK